MASGRDRAFYSGKHKAHGLNVQVIANPIGRLGWISPPLPGARHDVGAAGGRGIIDALTDAKIPAVAEPPTRAPGGRSPFRSGGDGSIRPPAAIARSRATRRTSTPPTPATVAPVSGSTPS
jgi:hypothetical protein